MIQNLNYFNNKKNSNLFFSLIYILIAYIFINNDFRIILYDSEPDYIANGLLILENGFPLNAHHPGTFTYYLISVILYFTKWINLSLSETIIAIRSIFFLIGLLIYLRFDKISKFNILICFSLFLLIPGFRLVINVFTAELLLIPFTFIVMELLKNKKKLSLYYIGILFGLMLNIKLASFVILPIIIITLLKQNDFNWSPLFKIFLITIITYLILIIPVYSGGLIAIKGAISNMIPFWEKIYSIIQFSAFSNIEKNLFIFSLILIVMFFTYLIIRLKIITYLIKKLKFNETIYILLISFIIIVFITIDFNNDFIRHFIIITPFGIDKIKIYLKNRKHINFLVFCLILVLFLFNLKKPINYKDELKSDQIINASSSRIFLYQSSILSSEISFIEWAKYRYAQSIDIIPKNWYNNHKIYSKGNIEYLNTRNYNHKKVIKINPFKTSALKISDDPSFNYEYCFFEQVNFINNNNSKLLIFKKDDEIFREDIKIISKKLKVNFEIILISSYNYFQIYTLKSSNPFLKKEFCD